MDRVTSSVVGCQHHASLMHAPIVNNYFRIPWLKNKSLNLIGGHKESWLKNSFMGMPGQIKLLSSSDVQFRDCRISSIATDEDYGQDIQTVDVEGPPVRDYIWHDEKRPRICILGGGFGGLYTALRLEELMWPPDKKPQVLLIDPSDRFVFKPLLYELLSKELDTWQVAPLYSDLVSNSSITFWKDKVKKISPCDGVYGKAALASEGKDIGGSCLLESGIRVEYDWLVLALGAETRMDMVPGAREFALPFSNLEDALEVEHRLKALERERFGPDQPLIQVTIVGSGYCGIELAAIVAERLGEGGKVRVIDTSSDICPNALEGNREIARKVLSSRNVELILGYMVTKIRKSFVENGCLPEKLPFGAFLLDLVPLNKTPRRAMPESSTLEADLVLWTAGGKPRLPNEAREQPFPLNSRGQMDSDEMLRVKDHERTFAIGDAAAFRDNSGRPLPAAAQVALQQADYAGWNLWAAINQRPLLPFRFQNLGEMMTLGKKDAAVSFTFMNGIALEGPIGHTARQLAFLYRLPTNEHKIKAGLGWFVNTAVDTVSAVTDTLTQIATNSD